MKTVYKYTLDYADKQRIMLPQGAKVLAVQMQDEYPHIWAEVDSEAPLQENTFFMVGTGHPLGEVARTAQVSYIGTIQTTAGGRNCLVFHIWRLGSNP